MESGATCVAYETVEDARGRLPLLAPMSEVAGRMSVQVGAFYLQKEFGGSGVLLGGVPGVPPARVAAIRAAFDATMKDPAYIAEAHKIHLDISPVDGKGIAALVHKIETAPQPMIDRLKALLARPGKS